MNNQEQTTTTPHELAEEAGADETVISEEASLETQLRYEPDAVIVAVNGDVDMNSAAALKVALLEAGADGLDVIVDLNGVKYMDSSGFGALLSASYPLRPFGAFLHLIGANAAITRMLDITRLNTIFVLHPTEADALASIRASSP